MYILYFLFTFAFMAIGDIHGQNAGFIWDNLSNLGPEIQTRIARKLAPLQNLEAHIKEEVYQQLEPIRQLMLKMKMMTGQGGITVVTFNPSGRKFVIKNTQMYQCSSSNITSSNGKCVDGQLVPFNPSVTTDLCFVNPGSSINNYLCFTTKSSDINIAVTNGNIQCRNSDGTNAFLIEINEYNKLCHNTTNEAVYNFFTTNLDFMKVKNVKCTNNNDNNVTCTFTETGRGSSNSNNIVTSSYNGLITNIQSTKFK